MDYVSINYYLLVIAAVAVYYILPKKIRWTALLAGSAAFYWFAVKDLRQIGLFVFTILVGYVGGRVLEKARKKYLLWIFIILGTAPLIAIRIGDLSLHSLLHRERFAWIIPLGLAYYSLQLISYLTDVCKG